MDYMKTGNFYTCFIFCSYPAIVSAIKVCYFNDLEQYVKINDMKTLSDDQANNQANNLGSGLRLYYGSDIKL